MDEPITGKVYTQEEFDKMLTAEVDRRVDSGIKKGLETHKTKWQSEYEQQARMTAEELAQKKLDEKLQEVQAREVEISKRTNKLTALEMFNGAGVNKAHYDGLIDLVVSSDPDVTAQNVQKIIDSFTITKTTFEQELASKLATIPKPQTGTQGETTITKSVFDKMSFSEKVELKNTNPELYKTYMK